MLSAWSQSPAARSRLRVHSAQAWMRVGEPCSWTWPVTRSKAMATSSVLSRQRRSPVMALGVSRMSYRQ